MRAKVIVSIVIIITTTATILFGTLWYWADKEVVSLQKKLNAINNLSSAKGYETVRFISFGGGNLTYGVPTQTKVNGQTYVNYDPKTSRLDSAVKIPDIAEGAQIQIHFATDKDFQRYIDGILVVPGL